jgi:hypothetical protein
MLLNSFLEYDVVEQTDRFVRGLKVNGTQFTVRIRQTQQLLDGVVRRIIDGLVRRALVALPNATRMSATVRQPATGGVCYSAWNQRLTQLGTAIEVDIKRVMQSEGTELTLDGGDLVIEIIAVETMGSGAARRRKIPGSLTMKESELRRSRLAIRQDSICLFRSVAVGIAFAEWDVLYQHRPPIDQQQLDAAKQRFDALNRDYGAPQEEAARALMADIGLNDDQAVYTVGDLNLLQRQFEGQYQFVLFALHDGDRIPYHLYRGEVTAPLKVYLFFENEHYTATKRDVPSFFNVWGKYNFNLINM